MHEMRFVKNLDRKKETRQKIMLGGLIVKANLEDEPSNVILGLLLEAKEKLASLSAEKIRQDWKIRGDLCFSNLDQEKIDE